MVGPAQLQVDARARRCWILNGGSAVLAANNRTHPLVEGFALRPRLAVAFTKPRGRSEAWLRARIGHLLLVGWPTTGHLPRHAASSWKPRARPGEGASAGHEGAHHGF